MDYNFGAFEGKFSNFRQLLEGYKQQKNQGISADGKNGSVLDESEIFQNQFDAAMYLKGRILENGKTTYFMQVLYKYSDSAEKYKAVNFDSINENFTAAENQNFANYVQDIKNN